LNATPPTPTPEQALLQQLTEFVRQHLQREDLGVQDLAAHLHLSQSQVYRKLKALSGHSPSLFIRYVRLRRAKEMLQDEFLSIAEVAYQVGFSDPNYFSRVFNQAFGQSPSDFRRAGEG
jgi:AraC-like DNA-binding protein